MGFSAIQDTLNLVYKVRETRPYWKAQGLAVLMTMLLAAIATLNLAVVLAGESSSRKSAYDRSGIGRCESAWSSAIHLITWIIACALLMLIFSTIYYYAPDLKKKCWRWLTPGAAFAIITWMLASLGFRAYLHFFNTLLADIWFAGCSDHSADVVLHHGLTLLAGAELNSEIQASVAEEATGSGWRAATRCPGCRFASNEKDAPPGR